MGITYASERKIPIIAIGKRNTGVHILCMVLVTYKNEDEAVEVLKICFYINGPNFKGGQYIRIDKIESQMVYIKKF